MTDTADYQPPEAAKTAHTAAWALAGPDRLVAVVQQHEAGPLTYYVRDARYSDGWRLVEDRDEIGALVADINAHQATQAEPVTSGPGPDPVLVKGDDGASHIGTGLAPEDSTGGGADDPEASTADGEATPTAGTTPDEDSED